MATLIVYSLFSVLLLGTVNECFGKRSCAESNYPVCATNGTHWYFFKNMCRLKSENTNRENNGLAKLDITEIANCFKLCNQVCNDEVAPICGVNDEDDQETFENRCQFDLENCRYGKVWTILHEGKCHIESLPNPEVEQPQPQVELPPVPNVETLPKPVGQQDSNPSVKPLPQPNSQDKPNPDAQPTPQPYIIPVPGPHAHPHPHVKPNPHPHPHPAPPQLLPIPQPNVQPNPQSQVQPLPIPEIIVHSIPPRPLPVPQPSVYPTQLPNVQQHPHFEPHPEPSFYPHPQPQIQPSPVPEPSFYPNPDSDLPYFKPYPIPSYQTYPHPDVNPLPYSHEFIHRQSPVYPAQVPEPILYPNPDSNVEQHLIPHFEPYPRPSYQTYPIPDANPLPYPQEFLNPQSQSVQPAPVPEPSVYSTPEPNVDQHVGPHFKPHPRPSFQTYPLPDVNILPHPHGHIHPQSYVQPHPRPHTKPYPHPRYNPHPHSHHEWAPPKPHTEQLPAPQPHSHTHYRPHSNAWPHPHHHHQRHPNPNALSHPIPHKHGHPLSYPHTHQPHSHTHYRPHPRPHVKPIPHSHTWPHPHHHHQDPNALSHPIPHKHGHPLWYPHSHTHPRPLPHPKIHPKPKLQPLPLPQPIPQPLPQDQPPKQLPGHSHPLIPIPINRRCPTECTLEYDPVCATFDGVDQTFENQCYMRADICGSKRAWVVKYNGECVPRCNENCPKIYSPMCATFNGRNKTFNNECLLDLEICVSGHPWDILYNGRCQNHIQNCPKICPQLYSPVCASHNGIQRGFPNKCFVEMEVCKAKEDWKIVHEGKCEHVKPPHLTPPPPPYDPTKNCPDVCLAVYDPICATFGGSKRTFSNGCELSSQNCKTGQNWRALYNGECESEHTTPIVPLCSSHYKPICATLNGLRKTFTNKCQMDAEVARTNHAWTFLSSGICESLPPYAQAPYQQPGLDQPPFVQPPADKPPISVQPPLDQPPFVLPPYVQQPFDKPPFVLPPLTLPPLEQPTPPPMACPACSDAYNPVCGFSDGQQRTFNNECLLLSENCSSNKKWTIGYEGVCSLDQPSIIVQPPLDQPPFVQPPLDQPPFDKPPFVLPPLTQPPLEQPTPPPMACPACSDAYNPVCGFSDGQQRTFNNECLLLSENCSSNKKWTVGYEGVCQSEEARRNCPNFCPLNYDPVCATLNGLSRTFPNECELNHEAYTTNKPWVILNIGECDYCPICSDDIAPVCAELDGQTKTFDNVCKVEAENCRNRKDWKLVSKTSCEINNCPKLCPLVYIPVCAISNGESRTFGNVCEMKREACITNTVWNIASKGECPHPVEKCPKGCSLQYNPVCAVYQGVLREFTNECFLRTQICKTQENWELLNAGSCADYPQLPCVGKNQEPHPRPIPKHEPICHIRKCSTIRHPVCATFNGEEKTFLNDCILNNFKCKSGQDWKKIKNGTCWKTSPRIGIQHIIHH